MNTNRFEYSGLVVKKSGAGWVVGKPVPRTIKGRPTEEITHKSWVSSLQEAMDVIFWRSWPLFMGNVESIAAPGDVLRQWRLSIGATQKEVCAASGVGVRTLREIEACRSDPRASTLGVLIRACSEIESRR